jgi:hypothetical protein
MSDSDGDVVDMNAWMRGAVTGRRGRRVALQRAEAKPGPNDELNAALRAQVQRGRINFDQPSRPDGAPDDAA